jgi:hypothetical protein
LPDPALVTKNVMFACCACARPAVARTAAAAIIIFIFMNHSPDCANVPPALPVGLTPASPAYSATHAHVIAPRRRTRDVAPVRAIKNPALPPGFVGFDRLLD